MKVSHSVDLGSQAFRFMMRSESRTLLSILRQIPTLARQSFNAFVPNVTSHALSEEKASESSEADKQRILEVDR